jgi:hypothetical protein
MKSSLYLIPLLSAVIATANAADSLNEEAAKTAYSSPEVQVAVEAARRFPTQAEYVGYEWYNRTTSKSFPLPKLLNTEMNNLVIEGAMGPTAAGEAAANEAGRPVRRVALGQSNEEDDLVEVDESVVPATPDEIKQPRTTYLPEVRAQNSTGQMVTREIRSAGSVTATAR